jgi:hypothetical protein
MKPLHASILGAVAAAALALFVVARCAQDFTPATGPVHGSAESSPPSQPLPSAPSILHPSAQPGTGSSQADLATSAEDETSPPPSSKELDDEAIEALLLELHELAMQDDTASMERIVTHLAHPSAEVRTTAVIALEQFGDPAAIPHLEAAARRSQDAQLKARIAEAIDFLKLPSLRDVLDEEGNLIADPREVPQQDE